MTLRPARVGLAWLTLCLAAVCITAPPALALENTSINRRDQAERYIQAMPISAVLQTSLVRVSSLMPPEHREPFFAYAQRTIDQGRIRAAVFKALTETFTAEELKAMADFFGSPVGQSAARKMGLYTQRVMVPVMTAVQEAATRYASQKAPQ
jgi:hypothetical protein